MKYRLNVYLKIYSMLIFMFIFTFKFIVNCVNMVLSFLQMNFFFKYNLLILLYKSNSKQ